MLLDIYLDGVIVAFILILIANYISWDNFKARYGTYKTIFYATTWTLTSWLYVFLLLRVILKKANNDAK